MKNRLKIKSILFILGVTLLSFHQNNLDIRLVGEWRYYGTKSTEFVDCPDFLILEEDGTYNILNDCYGRDPQNPVIENGKWFFDEKTQTLKLNKRDFSHGGGYNIWNKSDTQELKVHFSEADVIQLSYFSTEKQKEYLEIWKRIK